ncbi:Sir2 family NAD+-dependent deacetylase [Leucothrix arctica]|uniref:NAD-dependent protein deacylase n=1 Tax=Leucothrix arctica TaxID=1481894 RepID=A0A317C6C4_9GAMM|nr:Sir2 family NAD+-dependent deacetylase [Leucothrix arctica]PWQ93751.1 NAD-dependent protein deacylase [Leucothrix arctica]
MGSKQQNIVILTGAGISAESGIQTFRASDGLWHNHSIEEVATPEGFAANPSLVHRFYNERRKQLHDTDVHPNAAHHALAKLEREYDGKVVVVTQNVDNLHERAGSRNLIHMHGQLDKARCNNTLRSYQWLNDLDESSVCECCSKAGNLRPHIVWFGEMPFLMDQIQQMLEDCDLFISIGTSGQVYPAAGFSKHAQICGARTVELNLDDSETSATFDQSIKGLASSIVPEFVEQLLAVK